MWRQLNNSCSTIILKWDFLLLYFFWSSFVISVVLKNPDLNFEFFPVLCYTVRYLHCCKRTLRKRTTCSVPGSWRGWNFVSSVTWYFVVDELTRQMMKQWPDSRVARRSYIYVVHRSTQRECQRDYRRLFGGLSVQVQVLMKKFIEKTYREYISRCICKWYLDNMTNEIFSPIHAGEHLPTLPSALQSPQNARSEYG